MVFFVYVTEVLTLVDHAPVVGCFICPILIPACPLIEAFATRSEVMLWTSNYDAWESGGDDQQGEHD